MRATFVLPKVKNFEITKEFTLFALKIIEKVANYKITAKTQQKLNAKRAEFESKRESGQDKKEAAADRIKREKEEKWAKMTPKERKRAQEIETKRNKNRGMRKMKMK